MIRFNSMGLVLGWVMASVLLVSFLFSYSHHLLKVEAANLIASHLRNSFDESYFTPGRNTDIPILRRVGEELNKTLSGVIFSQWYAPLKSCSLGLQRIEDVVIYPQYPHPGAVATVHLGGKPRQLALDISCQADWRVAATASGILGLLFLAIFRFIPCPLTRTHRQWINYLGIHGYREDQAFQIVSPYSQHQLSLNALQRACFGRLHCPEQQNFSYALNIASDSRIARLKECELEWFLLGLTKTPNNIEAALELALTPDRVEIDLAGNQLIIHGQKVPVGKTPLFYYAWYAQKRITSPGWVSNPASNRPDATAGKELATLMRERGGHARAINDLEKHGLKARTLDQNRSKLRDELLAALGNHLADRYLFESRRLENGGRLSYRLCCAAESLKLKS